MENQEQYYLNDYQMNKACPDAIVYPDENGNPVKYTADSFASQEEFKRWKKWSDRSYADIESANRKEERNCVSLFEQDAPTPSAEETIIERDDRIQESIIQRELINPTGGYLSYRTVYDCFKRVVAKLGFPNTRFHDLRQTYAVVAIKSGDDIKTVQENLGHATAAFTLDIYGHVTDQMKHASADRMEAFIHAVSC